jgi:hypothetical protein
MAGTTLSIVLLAAYWALSGLPEPESIALFGVGLLLLARSVRRIQAEQAVAAVRRRLGQTPGFLRPREQEALSTAVLTLFPSAVAHVDLRSLS